MHIHIMISVNMLQIRCVLVISILLHIMYMFSTYTSNHINLCTVII